MGSLVAERLKQAVRPFFYRVMLPKKEHFECPICAYRGPFKDKRITRHADMVRLDSKCLGCGAAERHRMMQLVLRDVTENWDTAHKSLLHIAPEACLGERLAKLFGVYHTADLFLPGVDFKEDIQAMSFADASYDCVLVSRVLTVPLDLAASLREMRRILKPGGIAIIAEIHSHEKTIEFGEMRAGRSRQVGVDLIDVYAQHFSRVETFLSNRYGEQYQLTNRIRMNGSSADNYPALVRVPGVGFMELVAVCHA